MKRTTAETKLDCTYCDTLIMPGEECFAEECSYEEEPLRFAPVCVRCAGKEELTRQAYDHEHGVLA